MSKQSVATITRDLHPDHVTEDHVLCREHRTPDHFTFPTTISTAERAGRIFLRSAGPVLRLTLKVDQARYCSFNGLLCQSGSVARWASAVDDVMVGLALTHVATSDNGRKTRNNRSRYQACTQ